MKIGAGLSLPLGALLLFVFFLPWLEFSCRTPDGKEELLGIATGWQAAMGEMAQYSKDEEGKQYRVADPAAVAQNNAAVSARPWLLAGLIAPALLIVAGAAGLLGRLPAGAVAWCMVAAAVLGLFAVITASNTDYTEDLLAQGRQMKHAELAAQNLPPAQIEAAMQTYEATVRESLEKARLANAGPHTRPRTTVWFSLVLYMVIGLFGAIGAMRSGQPEPAASETPDAAHSPTDSPLPNAASPAAQPTAAASGSK